MHTLFKHEFSDPSFGSIDEFLFYRKCHVQSYVPEKYRDFKKRERECTDFLTTDTANSSISDLGQRRCINYIFRILSALASGASLTGERLSPLRRFLETSNDSLVSSPFLHIPTNSEPKLWTTSSSWSSHSSWQHSCRNYPRARNQRTRDSPYTPESLLKLFKLAFLTETTMEACAHMPPHPSCLLTGLVLPRVALRGIACLLFLGNHEYKNVFLRDHHFRVWVSFHIWLKQALGTFQRGGQIFS